MSDAGPGRRHEELLDRRHGAPRRVPEAPGLDGHGAPAQHREPLLGPPSAPRPCRAFRASSSSVGQEGEADGVAAGVGQREARIEGGGGQEAVRDLHQDAGAVARVDLGPRGAAVGQALEDGQAAVHDVVVGPAVQIGHHADAAGVVLVCRVVEASGHRRPSENGEKLNGDRDDVGPKVERPEYTTALVGWAHVGARPGRGGRGHRPRLRLATVTPRP